MKKQQLFNFALTTMCVAVLSACGSSGGGSLAVENTPTPSANANTGTGTGAGDNSAALAAAQKAAQEAEAQKAAAEKAAQDAAAKQAAAEETAKKAQAEAEQAKTDAAAQLQKAAEGLEQALKDAKQQGKNELLAEQEKAEQEKLAAKGAADGVNKANALDNKDKLVAKPDESNKANSFVGYKHVVKNDSNLITNSTREQDSKSSTPTPMRVQNPHASFDTIVVAEPVQDGSGAPRVYLEDFDTRRTTNDANVFGTTGTAASPAVHQGKAPTAIMKDGTIGNTALRNIYINSATKNINGDPAIEKQRDALGKVVTDLSTEIGDIQNKIDTNNKKLTGTASGSVPTADELLDPDVAKFGLKTLAEKSKEVLDGQSTIIPTPTDEQKQALQARVDVYSSQIAALNTANTELEEKKGNLERLVTAAKVEKARFDASNPKSTSTVTNSVNRDVSNKTDGLNYITKTDTQGQKHGGIWTFSLADIQAKHQNFTEYSKETTKSANTVKRGFKYEGKDANGNVLVSNTIPVVNLVADTNTAGVTLTAGNERVLAARQLDGTVAEIYGVRTKAYGSFDKPFDVMDQPTENGVKNVPANNLPLVNHYAGDRLKHVQYGRVSSALHGKDVLKSYKEGVLMQGDNIKTYVASFGEYGNKNTENHYFYRGLNNVGAKELELLKADHKNGTLVYEGHAVAYGLDNNYSGNLPVPTALGNNVGFISGNHARAEVNLATNGVIGSIYNKWFDGVNNPKDLVNVNLVEFNGTIGSNGNIAGTAIKKDDSSTGLFGATLFGKGTEIGGTVASDNKDAKKWGAVFGGKLQENPIPPVLPAAADGTDGKN